MNFAAPVCTSHCADCHVGCITLGEYYMVRAAVWEQAWAGRRKPWHALPGQQYLCIGCLEKRIGRTLTRRDFTDAPTNRLSEDMSPRLRNRLKATPRKLRGSANRAAMARWERTKADNLSE